MKITLNITIKKTFSGKGLWPGKVGGGGIIGGGENLEFTGL